MANSAHWVGRGDLPLRQSGRFRRPSHLKRAPSATERPISPPKTPPIGTKFGPVGGARQVWGDIVRQKLTRYRTLWRPAVSKFRGVRWNLPETCRRGGSLRPPHAAELVIPPQRGLTSGQNRPFCPRGARFSRPGWQNRPFCRRGGSRKLTWGTEIGYSVAAGVHTSRPIGQNRLFCCRGVPLQPTQGAEL